MDILATARSNYRSAAGLSGKDQPENSNRWVYLQNEMRHLIDAHQTVADVIAHGQEGSQFDHRAAIAGMENNIKFYRHCLNYEYPHFIDEINKFTDSAVSIASTLGENEVGSLVSNILYFHMFHILTSLTYRADIKTVCEVGGGYGGPARLWLTNPIQPLKNVTIIDLPESLFYAEVFLRAACPEANIVYCKTEQDCRNDDDDTFYLVPLELAQYTSAMQFDLLVNTGSMAELSDDWVLYWADWVGSQNCHLFYSHNYFAIPIDDLQESRNVIAPLVPAGWRVGQLRINHPLMILQSTGRNCAEIIFTRETEINDHNWIYDIHDLQFDEKMTLTAFAYFLFNLPAQVCTNVEAEMMVLGRAVRDLQVLPKELLYLTNRILASPAFADLPPAEQEFAVDLSNRLQELYQANFPEGHL